MQVKIAPKHPVIYRLNLQKLKKPLPKQRKAIVNQKLEQSKIKVFNKGMLCIEPIK